MVNARLPRLLEILTIGQTRLLTKLFDYGATAALPHEDDSGRLMTNAHSQPPSRTRPPRILIVEDDLVIALMIEEFVREFGYAVSSVAGTVAMARLQIGLRNFDAVLLDINMEGEYQPETADVLLEAGVPFAFVTGYDYVLEPRHEGVPLLEKPFGAIQLRVLLEKLVGPGSPSGNRSRGISA